MVFAISFSSKCKIEKNTTDMRPLLALFFIVLVTFGGCKSGKEIPNLDNVKWKLTHLNGKEVVLNYPENEIFMFFNGTEKKVNGRAACNRYFGNYEITDTKITFSSIGATRMACPGDGEWEAEFFQTLETVDTYTLKDDVLTLYSKDQPVAVFQGEKADIHTPMQ